MRKAPARLSELPCCGWVEARLRGGDHQNVHYEGLEIEAIMNDEAGIMYDMELAVQMDTQNDLYRRFQREVLDSWNEYPEKHSECDEYFEDEEVPHFESPEIPLFTVYCVHPIVGTERMFK